MIKDGTQISAEITCTGTVLANSRETKQRILIDSWHHEVHRLAKEEDGWRIVGNEGGDQAISRFGTAPHPIFQLCFLVTQLQLPSRSMLLSYPESNRL